MGPMAITSLLLGSSAQSLGYIEGDHDYIVCVLNISMLCGISLFCIGSCRLGVMANFLGPSVLTGFITASALIISLSQLKYITGITVPRFTYSHQTIWYLLSHLNECNPFALCIGISAWIILYGVKIWKKRNKAAGDKMKLLWYRIAQTLVNLSSLLAMLLGSIVAYSFESNGHSLDIVGYVPPGLKAPSFEFLGFASMVNFLPSALIISMISFSSNWAVVTKFAEINKYEVDATQEFLAQGMMNMFGPLFNSFVSSGGLARSAVNAESGATTQLSGCVAAVCVMISLECFTPVFYYIPMAILGSIIIVAVSSMIDFEEMVAAYHVDKKECAVMVGTFLCTFFIGISQGILVGIFLSIAFVMNESAFPHTSHLGQLPAEFGGHFRDVTRFPNAEQLPRVAIVRMDASLYFANASYLKEVVNDASLGYYHSSSIPIQLIVLDVSAWIDVDLCGIKSLMEIHSDLLKRNIQLAIANPKGKLIDRLKTAKFIEKLGENYLFGSIDDAVRTLNWRRRTLELELKAAQSDFQNIEELLSHQVDLKNESSDRLDSPVQIHSTAINALHYLTQAESESDIEIPIINPSIGGYNPLQKFES